MVLPSAIEPPNYTNKDKERCPLERVWATQSMNHSLGQSVGGTGMERRKMDMIAAPYLSVPPPCTTL